MHRVLPRVVGCLALVGSSLASAVCVAQPPPSPEDVSFPSNVVPNTSAARPVTLKARLFMPAVADRERVSVVVITPSSGGVMAHRELYYAQRLADAGIAALVVDSFGSRGLKDSVHDQTTLTAWQTGNDAVGALRWLSGDARFRHDKIGISGVSKGGEVALTTAMAVRRRWMRLDSGLTFAAHVPIVPPCQFSYRSTQSTGAPILFLLAELDDQTPAIHCVNVAEALRAAGNGAIEMRVYDGAHHAWEWLSARPEFDALAENYARCRGVIEDDTSFTAADGTRLPGRQWFEWARRTCMTRGGHCCGGTEELRRRAADDIVAFLKKHGF